MIEPRTSHVHADLVVIGFGKGGKTLAAALGRLGRRVVMVEQSADMYVGTCIPPPCTHLDVADGEPRHPPLPRSSSHGARRES